MVNILEINSLTAETMLLKMTSKRPEMDSLPVSMVPPKKRAWKPNDNQVDLNIREDFIIPYALYNIAYTIYKYIILCLKL